MIEKYCAGILLCLLLVAGVLIAGCSGDSGSASTATTVPATSTVAKYGAGDIIAKTASGGEQLYVITKYDAATDKYERAWIYKNSDGSWGHFIDSKTETSPRTIVEKVYPVRINHVTVSAIPVVTPTAAAAATLTYVGASPVVSSISPNRGVKDGTVVVTITGKNFQDRATASLLQPGASMVTGSATSVSSTSITTTFNLYGKEEGSYNVRVVNPDTRSDTLQNAFIIGDAVPVITSISPNEAEMNETVDSFTINGQNFKTTGVKVSFVLGSKEIVCVNAQSVDTSQITCGPVSFKKINNAQTGKWDVKVLNIEGQQSGTVSQKFTITNSTTIS
ncbi:MAG: IPT/TIG domain-containing protein [Methanoregula sp.]|nr:IPT/TIG domain-containing protein [Methanoregula sp.]